MFMSPARTEVVNIARAEAVFASGGKFADSKDEEEWDTFCNKLIGAAWRPSSWNTMSSKYVDEVYYKVEGAVRAAVTRRRMLPVRQLDRSERPSVVLGAL